MVSMLDNGLYTDRTSKVPYQTVQKNTVTRLYYLPLKSQHLPHVGASGEYTPRIYYLIYYSDVDDILW